MKKVKHVFGAVVGAVAIVLFGVSHGVWYIVAALSLQVEPSRTVDFFIWWAWLSLTFAGTRALFFSCTTLSWNLLSSAIGAAVFLLVEATAFWWTLPWYK